MTNMPPISPEYQAYKLVKAWEVEDKDKLEVEMFKLRKEFPFFDYLYPKTKALCLKLPKRKDGSDTFLHPLNVVWNIKKADVEEEIVFCAALAHDLVEETVDLYKKEHSMGASKEEIKILDHYEVKVFKDLEQELLEFSKQKNLNPEIALGIIETLKLLTRHKRHFYYRSISAIFNCTDAKIQKYAIQVKLADRIHNIQCLSAFDEQGRIYQCFKNLFILNNTKRFLLEKYGEECDTDNVTYPTEKLFKKCAKSTYNAFLQVDKELCVDKGISPVLSVLQLAFKKFAWEQKGWWEVTEVDENETHPMRLFKAIVRKYDARLHQETEEYNFLKNSEKDYCHKFFSNFNFNDEQLQAIIDYKDSFALRDVVARLIYKKDYVIAGFSCSKLCKRRMKCMRM